MAGCHLQRSLSTAAAEQSIRSIAAEVPESIVGAGSVANVATAERALAAGAR